VTKADVGKRPFSTLLKDEGIGEKTIFLRLSFSFDKVVNQRKNLKGRKL